MFEILVGLATIVGAIFAGLAYKRSRKGKNKKQESANTKLKEPINLEIRVKRIKENIPDSLPRIKTGKEVMNIVEGSDASSFDHDELKTEETELVGIFFDKLRDWGDLAGDMEPSFKVNLSTELTAEIKALEDAGFYVFGAREKQVLEGNGKTTDWSMAIVRVLHKK